MIEVYKLLHNLEDIPYSRFFELNETPTRGHTLKLKKKTCRKDSQKLFLSESYFSMELVAKSSGNCTAVKCF